MREETEKADDRLRNAISIDESDVEPLIEVRKFSSFPCSEKPSGSQSDDTEESNTSERIKMRKFGLMGDGMMRARGIKWRSERQVRDWETGK